MSLGTGTRGTSLGYPNAFNSSDAILIGVFVIAAPLAFTFTDEENEEKSI